MTAPDRTAPDEGFTLIELMVAMSLFLLIGALTFNTVVTGLHSQTRLTQRSSAMDDVRTAAQRMSRDIRESEVADARDLSLTMSQPLAGGSHRLLIWQVVGTDLTRTVQTQDATGAVTATAGPTAVLHNVSTSIVPFGYVKSASYAVTAGSGVSSTCQVAGVTPTRYSANCIGVIVLRLSRTLPTGPPVTLNQNVELRNS